MVLVQIFDRRQAKPDSFLVNQAASTDSHTCRIVVPWLGYRRCIKLLFFDLRCQFDSTQCHSSITELLEAEHWIVSLLDSPVILLDQVVQYLLVRTSV